MFTYFNGTLARSAMASGVLETLRKEIIMRNYAPGTKLTEQSICEKYGISRSPARQIIQQLENEGLVTMLDNGCKCTTEFTGHDLNCLYELRTYYELTAVRTIFASKTRLYSRLIETLSRLEDLSGLSQEEILALDVDFHRSIIEMSDNKYILKGYENIAPMLYTLFMISISLYEEQFFREFADRHRLLVRSILCDTEEECLEVFREHHKNAGMRARAALDGITGAGTEK